MCRTVPWLTAYISINKSAAKERRNPAKCIKPLIGSRSCWKIGFIPCSQELIQECKNIFYRKPVELASSVLTLLVHRFLAIF